MGSIQLSQAVLAWIYFFPSLHSAEFFLTKKLKTNDRLSPSRRRITSIYHPPLIGINAKPAPATMDENTAPLESPNMMGGPSPGVKSAAGAERAERARKGKQVRSSKESSLMSMLILRFGVLGTILTSRETKMS